MRTISELKISQNLKNKIDSFSEHLESGSFFLLIKPENNIFTNNLKKKLIHREIEKLINIGFTNLEISWSNNKNLIDFVSEIKLKYPKINLGSASIVNKKAIHESLRIGLGYSMMKYWDKDLFNYAKTKNHLLIPGIKNSKDLKEAINLNCKIIKIYPIKNKDNSIDLLKYKNVDFIAAGGLSITDIKNYKSLGFKAIVIGDKGFINQKLDPKIYTWLKEN